LQDKQPEGDRFLLPVTASQLVLLLETVRGLNVVQPHAWCRGAVNRAARAAMSVPLRILFWAMRLSFFTCWSLLHAAAGCGNPQW